VFGNDEQFDRLVRELRIDTRCDAQHREALRQRMLAQFHRARMETSAGRLRIWTAEMKGKVMSSKTIAAAAAAVVVMCGVAVALLVGGRAQIALADVQQKLASVSVLGLTMEFAGGGESSVRGQGYVTPDSKTRFETDEMVMVIHWQEGRILILYPQEKLAVLSDVKNLESNPYHEDWYKELEDIVSSESATRVGKQTIAGREVIGWRIGDDDGWTVTVWADAKSAELARIEFVRDEGRMVFSDFRYDVAVDPSLLSLEAPAGYTVQRGEVDLAEASEKDILCLLLVWAKGNGDVFPDDPMESWKFGDAARRVEWMSIDWASIGVADAPAASWAVSRAFWWLGAEPGWGYGGKGVTLGDETAPVFWYRPEGSKKYRVVYGDLHVADADAAPQAK